MDLHEKALEIHPQAVPDLWLSYRLFPYARPLKRAWSAPCSRTAPATRTAGRPSKRCASASPIGPPSPPRPWRRSRRRSPASPGRSRRRRASNRFCAPSRPKRGVLSLDFLADLPVEEARAWLERLPGVGPKTSAAVLSFSTLRRPALPVDSHHHRVAARTGLIPSRPGRGPVASRAGGATAARVGRAAYLRQSRGADAARPALLLLSQAGVRALSIAGAMPDRTGLDAGCDWCRRR